MLVIRERLLGALRGGSRGAGASKGLFPGWPHPVPTPPPRNRVWRRGRRRSRPGAGGAGPGPRAAPGVGWGPTLRPVGDGLVHPPPLHRPRCQVGARCLRLSLWGACSCVWLMCTEVWNMSTSRPVTLVAPARPSSPASPCPLPPYTQGQCARRAECQAGGSAGEAGRPPPQAGCCTRGQRG